MAQRRYPTTSDCSFDRDYTLPKPNSGTRRNASTTPHLSELRIIGGRFRGRKLQFPGIEGLRPTGDRIRETLFNWLAPELSAARCLDLFAGSGALGFESLSRGAAQVTLFEKDRGAFLSLQQNLIKLDCANADVRHADALLSLAQKPTEPFDIVYLDPPFASNLWQPCVDLLEANHWLAEHASIYVELPKDQPFIAPSHWHLHRDKQAGLVSYRLYYRNYSTEERPETY